MTKVPKQKTSTPKYYDAEEIQSEVEKILHAYPERFTSFGVGDIKFLFKTGKETTGTKHVVLRLLREPHTHLTTKKMMFIVVDGWWQNNIESDRVKAYVEALCSVKLDNDGTLKPRKFDVQTFSEFLQDGKLDYSKFQKVLPAEAAEEKLILS